MPNFFSGLYEGYKTGRENRANRQQRDFENQIKYMGLVQDQQNRGIEQEKLNLERQRLQGELEDAQFKRSLRKGFGSSGSSPNTFGGSTYVYNPYTDKFEEDPREKATRELSQKRQEEEIKREFELQKPLSDTGATRLSAAEQSLGNIGTLRKMATPKRFGEMKRGFEKVRIGNRLGITNPESVIGMGIRSLPVLGQVAKFAVSSSDEQKKFENNISTLIESQLRARTGAAAPQQEIDREVSRILSSDDSLKSFLEKLTNAEKFAIGVAEGIRPGSTKKFGQRSEVFIPDWAKSEPDIYLAAKQNGFDEASIEDWFRRNAS